MVKKKTYETLFVKLWEIFPKFCKFSTDISKHLNPLLKMTEDYIIKYEIIRAYLCQGIENVTSYIITYPKASIEMT